MPTERTAPGFVKRSAQTVVTRIYDVTDAPTVEVPFTASTSSTFRPKVLTLTITDGSVSRVALDGPRVRKNGSDGAAWTGTQLYGPRHDWPAWVLTFIEGMGL